MSLPDTLPHLTDIQISDRVAGDAVDDYEDPETLYSDEPCWVQPASDREIVQYERQDQVVTHKVYFSRNLSIKPGYIILPSSGPFSGKYLQVKSANECTAGTGLLYRVMVREIQAE